MEVGLPYNCRKCYICQTYFGYLNDNNHIVGGPYSGQSCMMLWDSYHKMLLSLVTLIRRQSLIIYKVLRVSVFWEKSCDGQTLWDLRFCVAKEKSVLPIVSVLCSISCITWIPQNSYNELNNTVCLGLHEPLKSIMSQLRQTLQAEGCRIWLCISCVVNPCRV